MLAAGMNVSVLLDVLFILCFSDSSVTVGKLKN